MIDTSAKPENLAQSAEELSEPVYQLLIRIGWEYSHPDNQRLFHRRLVLNTMEIDRIRKQRFVSFLVALQHIQQEGRGEVVN